MLDGSVPQDQMAMGFSVNGRVAGPIAQPGKPTILHEKRFFMRLECQRSQFRELLHVPRGLKRKFIIFSGKAGFWPLGDVATTISDYGREFSC